MSDSMARKRRSVNNPELSYYHYAVALKKNATAYKNMNESMQRQFDAGTQALAEVQKTARDYLNQASNSMELPVIGQVSASLIRVASAWLKASNEGYNGMALTGRVSQIATMVATETYKSTSLTCDELGEIINGMLKAIGGYTGQGDPLEFMVDDEICVARPSAPMTPKAVSSASSGLSAPLEKVLTAKTPEDIVKEASMTG